MRPENPELSSQPGSGSVASHVTRTGRFVVVPSLGSSWKGSFRSPRPSLSSFGSLRSDVLSPSQSGGTSPLEQGSVPLSISSALSNPSPSSSTFGSSAPEQGGGVVPPKSFGSKIAIWSLPWRPTQIVPGNCPPSPWAVTSSGLFPYPETGSCDLLWSRPDEVRAMRKIVPVPPWSICASRRFPFIVPSKLEAGYSAIPFVEKLKNVRPSLLGSFGAPP